MVELAVTELAMVKSSSFDEDVQAEPRLIIILEISARSERSLENILSSLAGISDESKALSSIESECSDSRVEDMLKFWKSAGSSGDMRWRT